MRRSYLFVPGDSERKLAKARQRRADVLILDWEDAVLPGNKARARELSLEFVLAGSPSDSAVLIRCNPAGSPSFEEDCVALRRIPSEGVLLSVGASPDEARHAASPASRSLSGVWNRVRCRRDTPCIRRLIRAS